MTKKVSKESLDITKEKIAQLKKLFPEVISEGRIDVKKLRRTLGEDVDGKEEKYGFNWAGRKDTFKNIQTTAKGTLIVSQKDSVNFDMTRNLFIEGDNLEVMKLLHKAYFGKIKMIYIDPPYNTGNDLVYKDDFKKSLQAYLEQTGQSNGEGIKFTTNPETNGRFHSDWMSMIYPRLFIARNLLRDDGVIFVSIDDNEIHNLRMIMNEIFGEENFIAEMVWRRKAGGASDSKYIAKDHEYILCFVKDKDSRRYFEVLHSKKDEERFTLEDEKGKYYLKTLEMPERLGLRPNLEFPIEAPDGSKIEDKRKDKKYTWVVSEDRFEKMKNNNEIVFKKIKNGEWRVYRKLYMGVKTPRSLLYDIAFNRNATEEMKRLLGHPDIFSNPKPTKLIKHLIEIASEGEDGEIFLDFFAGSATLAHAVYDINNNEEVQKHWICIQLPEVVDPKEKSQEAAAKFLKSIKKPLIISEISKERIRRAAKEIKKINRGNLVKKDIDLGFKVFKLHQSNYKIWESYKGQDKKQLKKQMELFKSPLMSGYKELDVIYECIIKEGFSLNSKIEKTTIKSNKVYKVTDGEMFFYVCLDHDIKDKTINELKLKKDTMFICLDESLTDSKKTNLAVQCNLKTI